MRSHDVGVHGPEASVIGLGGNNFGRPGSATVDAAGTDAVISAAIDAGVTLIDTADIYNDGRSEALIGEVLGSRRNRVLIATKFGHAGATAPGAEEWGAKGSAGYITKAVEASLRRLRTDWIDLLQMHTPDPGTPVEETLAALDKLAGQGKVRWFGCSNVTADQLRQADAAAASLGVQGFVSVQNEYSLLKRGVERDVLPVVKELGLGFLPYFPLAAGLLTGKYHRDAEPPAGTRLINRRDMLASADWDAIEAFTRICDEIGRPPVDVAIAWLLAQPVVSCVISGATTSEQVRQNVAAADLRLDARQVARLSAIARPVA